MKAWLESVGATEKQLAMHVAINGQVFWQSGTAGFSCGQHGILAGISAIFATAIAVPLTEAVNSPTTSPTIARIGSSLRSQMLTIVNERMPHPRRSGECAFFH